MVHGHNKHPGFITRFLRANAAHVSFAVMCGAAVLHFTGEQRIGLSYPVPQEDGTVLYGHGVEDAYFMFVAVFFLTLLRSVFVQQISRPLGSFMKVLLSCGLPELLQLSLTGCLDGLLSQIKGKDQVKFDDMAWQGTYYTVAWVSGFTIMSVFSWFCFAECALFVKFWSIVCGHIRRCKHADDWGFQVDQLTTSFPDKLIEGDMKLYYMLQCSFWIHVRPICRFPTASVAEWHHFLSI